MTGRGEKGFSLIEVMLAMVILAFAVVGVMGMHQWGEQGMRYGADGTRALAMAESRLEAKRAMPWESLLQDVLDADGQAEVVMRDDGRGADEREGDGVYTASADADDIKLVWTVQPDRPGSLRDSGSAVILVRANFPAGPGRRRDLSLGTLRANPNYVGPR
ncbi:MAG: prepilin-type N-terminal cleavage/methylation domain-containing protein [Nitrospiraceae bacterium]